MPDWYDRLTAAVRQPSRRRITVSPDLAETNRQLARIAHALEQIVLRSLDHDITKEGQPVERPAKRKDYEPIFLGELDREEVIAVIESLEESGEELPLDVYERLDIEPPDRRADRLHRERSPLEEDRGAEEEKPEVDEEVDLE
jgi:hypothetical protein